MKDFFVSDAPRYDNQVVTSYFALAALGTRERKGGGGQYLAITLADKTGQLEARMWEDFADVVQTCSEGCYVKAQGQISKYQGKFQITLTRMRNAADVEINKADFVPTTVYDIDAMDRELRSYVAEFANKHLQRLVLSFLDDGEIGPAFREAPAAKKLHHAWIGGLLEHVLSLVRVCMAVAPLYPEVDRDLLITGAILHDIGKVKELTWSSGFGYSLEGHLIGHITIGIAMVRERVALLNKTATEAARAQEGVDHEVFPAKYLLLLEHLMLSHHGKLEFGSPKLPATPESILLSALDDLEAKFQTMRTTFAETKNAGRPANATTEFVRSMDRALFDSYRFLHGDGEAKEAATVTPSNPSEEQSDLSDAPPLTVSGLFPEA